MAWTEMRPEEEALAEDLYGAVRVASTETERAQQAGNFIIGVSDIGTCPERTRRLLAKIPEEEPSDKLSAFIGTAYGEFFERAVKAKHPEVMVQAEVRGTLTAGTTEFGLMGHPDILWPREDYGLVIDGKTVDGLETVKRTGPDDQQLFQRHLYALLAHQSGVPGFEDLNRIKTANVWADRSGSTPEFYVHMDDYQQEIVDAAGVWLEDVFYALDHNIEAEKVPPRNWCAMACGHFRTCRQFDTDVQGLLTDPAILQAVAMHEEGKELAAAGDRLKKEAKKALAGVSGFTSDGFSIRWIHVNATSGGYVAPRRPYERLEVMAVKR